MIEAVNYPASTTLKDGTTVTIRAIVKMIEVPCSQRSTTRIQS